jgi:hypothetical protein
MADPKDPKLDPRFLWVFKRMASSLTEPRYFDKLKITFFQDENGIAFVKQFLDETGYQVRGSAFFGFLLSNGVFVWVLHAIAISPCCFGFRLPARTRRPSTLPAAARK